MRIRLDTKGFNAGLAAFAAASVGFAIFAMPEHVFGSIVSATGIPALIPAAAPPLGQTARLAVAGVAALLFGLFVWSLMRSFDAKAAVVEDDEEEEFLESEWLAPRLRRADSHPDAPTLRPLIAGRDLGEPEGDAQDAPADAETPDVADVTLELHRDQMHPDTAEVQSDPVPADPEPAPEPQPETEVAEFEPPVVEAEFPLPEPQPSEARFVDARPSEVAEADQEDEDVEEEPQHEGIATESLADQLPLPEHEGESVSSLLHRLDSGLANCEWPLANADNDQPRPSQEKLRSVIDDLQKMAGRNG